MNNKKVDQRIIISVIVFIAIFSVTREIINLTRKPSEQQVTKFFKEVEVDINNRLDNNVISSVNVYKEGGNKVVLEYIANVEYTKESVNNAITATMNELDNQDMNENIKKINSFLKAKDFSLFYRYLDSDKSLIFELEYNSDGFKGYKVGDKYLNN